MSNLKNKIYIWLPLIIALSAGLGLWFGAKFFARTADQQDITATEKLNMIIREIQDKYVDAVNIDSLLEKSLPDIMAQLDPHSTYISAADLHIYNEDIEGSFSGIGIRFNVMTDTVTVDEVISGGPSEKVGIMAGDRIVTVNDTLIVGPEWTNERIIKSLRGPKNSEVVLGIKRDNADELLSYTVVRGDVPVTSVDASYIIADGIGYLKINKFAEKTYDEFLNSMVSLSSQGARKFILDMRGNGGGLMDGAINMSNEFLQSGDGIVSTRGRLPEYNTSVAANGLGSFRDAELIILIDESSASATEILAGAIQDNDRGTIIGRRSFGKGLVQNQIEFPDHSALRLTVARYYTPSGRCIQKNYTPGNIDSYLGEIASRYQHGEGFSADSMKIDRSEVFHTVGGREVYGGGGIVPDVYVPNDTIGITDYYIKVLNAGLLQKFSFNYVDTNRANFSNATTADQVLALLPSDDYLLSDFVSYASREGKIAPRWFYINQSRTLITDILKALIARDVLGTAAYYEVINRSDTTVNKALEILTQSAD